MGHDNWQCNVGVIISDHEPNWLELADQKHLIDVTPRQNVYVLNVS